MDCECTISREHQNYIIDNTEAAEWPSVANDSQWATAMLNFEYILMAPTSAAIPIHDEPVTFLNQHCPYEVKCRTSDAPADKHSLVRTVVTVCFENRKIRYESKKQIDEWKKRQPGKRFISFDFPMCSNVTEVKYGLRSAEFVWDSSEQNTSVFLKFFVVSSDFIASAGEKGQPFRLVFQTYLKDSNELVHQSSSQIQIFKLRGAERKRLTEREKAAKLGNQEQFQPAYDYTILLSTPFDYEVENESRGEVWDTADNQNTDSAASSAVESASDLVLSQPNCSATSSVPTCRLPVANEASFPPTTSVSSGMKRKLTYSGTFQEENWSSRETSVETEPKTRFRSSFSASETVEWLRLNRFSKYISLFAEYDGEDLLRMNISELTSLMDSTAEAIRLFHAMHKKNVEPQCVLYMAVEDDDVHNMVLLQDGSASELRQRVQDLAKKQVNTMLMRGPCGIRVAITDEVVQSWPTQSIFRISFNGDKCVLTPEKHS